MFDKKLTLVALLSVGLLACTQDKPEPAAEATKAPAAEKVATNTAPAPEAAATEEGYNCSGEQKQHAGCDGAEKEHEGGGCNQWDDAASEVTKRNVEDDAVWVAFDVDGMTCGGCERRIQAKVGELDGVVAVEASSELSRVRIAFDKGSEDESAARERIASLGYNVR